MKWTLPDGRPFLVCSKTENGYLLHFVNLADFFVDRAGSDIAYVPLPGVPANSVRHLVLDHVLALVLSLRGRAIFHASAIVTPMGACAFLAPSGVGKSTLAASFQGAGYPLLTDDCLLVESDGDSPYGVPSYPGVRLRDDSLSMVNAPGPTRSVAHYNSKRRVSAGEFAANRHPLAAIYSLERPRDGEEISECKIAKISGSQSLLTALSCLFCIDTHDPVMLVRQFKTLEKLLSRVPIARLSIPDNFSALPQVHQAVLSDVEARNEAGAISPS